ncbi:MAG: hypothetical protein Q9165_007726 [Trypethelium subeluteriae]
MAPYTMRNTVDRLDKPSTYTANKVQFLLAPLRELEVEALKNRKRNRNQRDDDRDGGREKTPEFQDNLKNATTLYVGNLCGEIKRLIMGLDRFQKTPCGFCFVEYYNHQDALDCMKYIGGTKLDERLIRTDLDEGFSEGRQYGRGKSGGQVRDEYRNEFDPGRGGYGKALTEDLDDEKTYR